MIPLLDISNCLRRVRTVYCSREGYGQPEGWGIRSCSCIHPILNSELKTLNDENAHKMIF